VIALYRRGRISGADADRELDTVAREAATLREELESLKAQDALAMAAEEHLRSAATMLAQLRDNLETIEASGDVTATAAYVRMLVHEIVVTTEGEGRDKRATARVRYAFSSSRAIASLTA